MHKIHSILLFFAVLLAPFFQACNDGFDDYSLSPNDLLVFSTDTVAFDTIISTVNTPFRAFKVYNPHSKALLISSIYLENGTKSGFKINVDGKAGYSFDNVEIRGKDSLFVFVDAKPAETHSNQPEQVNDRIIFITNGIQQPVVLAAAAQDAFIWKGKTIDTYLILSNDKPYLIYDSLVIESGVTLQIREGTTLYMHNNAEIIVKGRLIAKGTREKPVVIRGDRFDYMVDIPYDLIPGQWGGIRFESESYDNELDYANIRNGRYGLDFRLSELERTKMTITNSVITNFKGMLINAFNCVIEAENCEFSNARDGLLNLQGGVYLFVHCTIANYYPNNKQAGWGNSDNATVNLITSWIDETTQDSVFYPIWQADFRNTVIWGDNPNKGSHIHFYATEKAPMGLFFQNCVLPNDTTTMWNDNPNDSIVKVLDCLIHIDPKFKKVDRNSSSFDFRFDFHLDSISPARNMADPAVARIFPYDIDNYDRFADGKPDIGAYEWH